jgi:hypothetical protein
MWTKNKAQQAFDAEGVTVIVYSILRYKSSNELVVVGLNLLGAMEANLSNDKVFQTLVRLDFLNKIPLLVSGESNQSGVHSATRLLTLLSASARNNELRLKLGSDAIVKFMIHVMASYCDDDSKIAMACQYFTMVCSAPKVKDRLRKQGLLVLLAAALQKYSNWDRKVARNEDDTHSSTSIVEDCKATLAQLVN